MGLQLLKLASPQGNVKTIFTTANGSLFLFSLLHHKGFLSEKYIPGPPHPC